MSSSVRTTATVAAIRDLTDGLGVDGAVEYTGNPQLARLCIDVIRPGGTIVPVGADWSGERFPIVDQDFARLELNLRGIRGSTLNDQRIVLDLLGRGVIKPAIHAVMPLSAIAQAHELLERSESKGASCSIPGTTRESRKSIGGLTRKIASATKARCRGRGTS